MDAKDVINLVNAGFSKDDILKMFPETQPVQTQTQPVQTPTVQTPPVQTPPVQTPTVQTPPVQTPPVQTPTVQTTPAQDQTAETIKNLTTQVTTLTEIIKTMQTDAIKNAGGGKPETKTSLDVVKDFFGQTTK